VTLERRNMKKKVIARKNLPTNLNLFNLVTLWLLLDRFNIPLWGWGVYWTLIVFEVIGMFMNLYNEEEIEILKEPGVVNVKTK
jgi:hypothetical protein